MNFKIVEDPTCPPNTLYFIDPRAIYHSEDRYNAMMKNAWELEWLTIPNNFVLGEE